MKSFLAGVGTGVALGMLFATRSGDATHQQLRSKADEVRNRAQDQAERIRRTAGNLQQQAGSFVARAAAEARTGTSRIKDSAQRVAMRAGVGPLALLNTASREELMDIRGIGPVLADRIIEGRPFTSAEEVVERGILPADLLEDLKRELKSA